MTKCNFSDTPWAANVLNTIMVVLSECCKIDSALFFFFFFFSLCNQWSLWCARQRGQSPLFMSIPDMKRRNGRSSIWITLELLIDKDKEGVLAKRTLEVTKICTKDYWKARGELWHHITEGRGGLMCNEDRRCERRCAHSHFKKAASGFSSQRWKQMSSRS